MANKIGFLKECEVGSYVEIDGLISSVELKQKQNKENFLMITMVDSDSELIFPIWDKVDARYEKLAVGQILTVLGTVSLYDNTKQIRVSSLAIRELKDDERENFIPSYCIPDDLVHKFGNYVLNLSEPWKSVVSRAIGFGDEIKWNNFLIAPAAVRHHHNKLGGLFIHTYGVTLSTISIVNNYIDNPFFINASNVINRDRVISAAMLHDICKREEYKYDTTIGYGNNRFDHRLKFLPYIERVNNELKAEDKPYLNEDQLESLQELVLTHHGPWGGYKPKNVESLIVFLADMTDSQIVGCAENENPVIRMTISSMMDAE